MQDGKIEYRFFQTKNRSHSGDLCVEVSGRVRGMVVRDDLALVRLTLGPSPKKELVL